MILVTEAGEVLGSQVMSVKNQVLGCHYYPCGPCLPVKSHAEFCDVEVLIFTPRALRS